MDFDMDDNKQALSPDRDTEELGINNDKRRRSSILKPQKPRNPFSTLDFSEPNPDNTLGKASRRVSFASSNFVKPFAADPEKNTIWDNTYEEEVNHTDSTKSSYEQTQEAKSKDAFNVSSIYFPEIDCKDENIIKNPNKPKSELVLSAEIIRSEKYVAIDKENINPNNSMRIFKTNTDESMNITTCNRTTYFENSLEMTVPVEKYIICNQPIISPSNETVNSASTSNKTIYFENTMETTINLINKENVNPLINDISLFKPRTKFDVHNSLKVEDINKQKTFNKNNYTFQKSKLEDKCFINNCDKRNVQSQSNMEICEDKDNTDEFEERNRFIDILESNDRTIYFNKSEDSMEFTKVLETEEKILPTRKFINNLNNSENEMGLTCNYSEVQEIMNPASLKKISEPRTTLQSIQFEANKGLTTNLPVKVDVENNFQSCNSDNNESSMELTGILPFKNDTVSYIHHENNLLQGNIHKDSNVYNNELLNVTSETETRNKKGDISNAMEVTSNLTAMQISQYAEQGTSLIRSNENLTRKSESDMQLTCNFPTNKEKNHKFDVETKYIELNGEYRTLSDQNLIKIDSSLKKMETSQSKVNIAQDRLNSHQKFVNFSQLDPQLKSSDMNVTGNILPGTEIEGNKISLNSTQEKLVNKMKDANIDNISKNIHNLVLDNKKNNISKSDHKNNTVNIATVQNLYIEEQLCTEIQNNDGTNKSDLSNNYRENICESDFKKADKSLRENAVASFNIGNTSNIKRCSSEKTFENILAKKRKTTDLEIGEDEQNLENILMCFDETENKNELKSVAIEVSQENKADTNIINKANTENAYIDNSHLQTVALSNSNVLYSEPMKLKAEHHNLTLISDSSADINLQVMDGSLDLKSKQLSTPASSFHINFTNISSCTEDTQQLIYATISKPESSKILSDDKSLNEEYLVESKQLINSEMKESSGHSNIFLKVNDKNLSDKIIKKTYTKDKSNHQFSVSADIAECIDLKEENCDKKTDDVNKSNTVSSLLESDCEDDTSVIDLNHRNISLPNSDGILSSDNGNYTLRCQHVLKDIKKYLIRLEIEEDDDDDLSLMTKSLQRFNENLSILKQSTTNWIMQKKHLNLKLPSLEKKHKLHIEENTKKLNEVIVNKVDSKSYKDDLSDRKSLYNRVLEICERSKRYLELVKMEDSEYYFTTLFGTLPFKVRVHSELGIVYGIKTFENLEDIAKPISWYDLRVFQHKLKMENLISVLGVQFDLFALLDYTYLTMDEVINFHMEYLNLEKKYGVSHHFRMDADFNVIFEVLQVDLIIWWVITIKMSLETTASMCDITAISKIGEKVSEEDIKSIAKNTTKGLNFLRNFIDNVEEYLERIKKRINFRRRKQN